MEHSKKELLIDLEEKGINLIAFKCSKCDNEYNESFVEHVNKNYPPLDLNEDGIVNGKDFAYIMKGYQKRNE